MPETRFTEFPALSVDDGWDFLLLHQNYNISFVIFVFFLIFFDILCRMYNDLRCIRGA